MTHRPLRFLDETTLSFSLFNETIIHNAVKRDNELFEIRLDRLVDKWSGSIEVAHPDL